jgi:hypothetical protein
VPFLLRQRVEVTYGFPLGRAVEPPSQSPLQPHPRRRVVACAVFSAHVPVDARLGETQGKVWAEQEVIEAQACIAEPSVPLIVPEAIDAPVWVQFPDRVGPATTEQAAKRSAAFGLHQRIVIP